MYKQELISLIKPNVKHGEFRLASGRTSSYYIDMSQVLYSPEGIQLACNLVSECICWDEVDAIGGPAMGAIPIISGLLALRAPRRLTGFIIRKDMKEHGLRDVFEGIVPGHSQVVLVEDVTTTGGSVIKSVDLLLKSYPQIKINQIISLLDREEGASDLISRRGILFTTIITLKEVL